MAIEGNRRYLGTSEMGPYLILSKNSCVPERFFFSGRPFEGDLTAHRAVDPAILLRGHQFRRPASRTKSKAELARQGSFGHAKIALHFMKTFNQIAFRSRMHRQLLPSGAQFFRNKRDREKGGMESVDIHR